MSLVAWVLFYLFDIAFWLWIVRWGGAETLEGAFSGCLFPWLATRWDADGIRLFGWCALIGSTVWFIAGAFWPDFRF
ncbi:MAG: hypothetical protein ACYS8K_11385 [Planctomycetota bacterium]|jgi:hypothetical protein